jgi:hypothetical protein
MASMPGTPPMASPTDSDRFTLEAPPASAKARVVARIRAEHAARDRAAERDPACAALRARAFIAMAGEILIGVFDPVEDGASLGGVLDQLCRRCRADFVVSRQARIVAVVRRQRNGRPVVLTFDEQ